MRRTLIAFAVGAMFALAPAIAADAPPAPKAAAAPAKSRAKPSLERMHETHKQKVGLECGDCHGEKQVDTLVMKTYASMAVDRNACAGCHRPPNRPAWYGPAPK